MEPPSTILDFVDAVSRADGERAGMLVTQDATFRLPGERELPAGEAGARAFAAKHAESDGRKPSVELVDASPRCRPSPRTRKPSRPRAGSALAR